MYSPRMSVLFTLDRKKKDHTKMRSRLQTFDKENPPPLHVLCIAVLLALSTSLCLLTYHMRFKERSLRRPPTVLVLRLMPSQRRL